MASTDIKNVTATFTYPNIPRNVEEPTFETTWSVHKLLNHNAMGILHGAYGNILGMLGLPKTPAAYNTLAGADFITPTAPANLVILPFASNIQVTEIMQVYNKTVYDQATGYKEAIVLQLLQHLYENYGQLDSMQLTANSDEIRGDYDPTMPIEKHIVCIEKCMGIAANRSTPCCCNKS
eukprot:7719964-Ditylum_brightwellii.AAC.1